MKRSAFLLAVGITTLGLTFLVPPTTSSAKQATIQQNIYPLVCDIDIVYDGVNEAYLLSPDDCNTPPVTEVPEETPEAPMPNPLGILPVIDDKEDITLPIETISVVPPQTIPALATGYDTTTQRVDPSPANVTTAAVAVGVFLVVQVAAIQLGLFEPVGRIVSRLHLFDLFKK